MGDARQGAGNGKGTIMIVPLGGRTPVLAAGFE